MAMKYIILTQQAVQDLKQALQDYMATTKYGTLQNYFKETGEGFHIQRIRDDNGDGKRYALPFTIKDHPKFGKLKELVNEGGITGITVETLDRKHLPDYDAEDYTKVK